MRVLTCGGRDYPDYWTVFEVLDGTHAANPITMLIEGGALGADRFARRWASGNAIPVWTFEADWSGRRGAAGPIRNARMLKDGMPDLVIAFPGGKGTANMVGQARKAGVEVREILE